MDLVRQSFEGVLGQLASPASKLAYEADWLRFLVWLRIERVEVSAVKPKNVMAHLAHLRERGMKRTTINRALSVIREAYAALVRDEVVQVNPAREVKAPKMSASLKTPWISDEGDVVKLTSLPAESWRERRDRLCVLLLFGLGWRRTEVARLAVADVGEHTITGVFKGNKRVIVGLPVWLAGEIASWLAYAGISTGPVLPRAPDSGEAISGDIVYNIVRDSCLQAGIARISPHGLRRTNLTLTGKRGISLKERQLSVGHASQATTEHYDKMRETEENAPGRVLEDLVKGRTS